MLLFNDLFEGETTKYLQRGHFVAGIDDEGNSTLYHVFIIIDQGNKIQIYAEDIENKGVTLIVDCTTPVLILGGVYLEFSILTQQNKIIQTMLYEIFTDEELHTAIEVLSMWNKEFKNKWRLIKLLSYKEVLILQDSDKHCIS